MYESLLLCWWYLSTRAFCRKPTGINKYICATYGEEHDILYNPLKSKCMIIKPNRCKLKIPDVYINDVKLEYVQQIKYMGVILTNTFKDKAIRDGRPRPPRYYIPLHFDTNPESLRPFVPEIWPNNVFNLSATYDLDLWPKILKIFVSHGVPIRNMYAKLIGWEMAEILHFEILRKHGQTHKQTDMGITIPRPPPMGGEVMTWT